MVVCSLFPGVLPSSQSVASGKKTKPFFFYFYLKPREKLLKVDVSDSKKSNISLLFFPDVGFESVVFSH